MSKSNIEVDVETIERLGSRYIAVLAVDYVARFPVLTVSCLFVNGQAAKNFDSFPEALRGIASMLEGQEKSSQAKEQAKKESTS